MRPSPEGELGIRPVENPTEQQEDFTYHTSSFEEFGAGHVEFVNQEMERDIIQATMKLEGLGAGPTDLEEADRAANTYKKGVHEATERFQSQDEILADFDAAVGTKAAEEKAEKVEDTHPAKDEEAIDLTEADLIDEGEEPIELTEKDLLPEEKILNAEKIEPYTLTPDPYAEERRIARANYEAAKKAERPVEPTIFEKTHVRAEVQMQHAEPKERGLLGSFLNRIAEKVQPIIDPILLASVEANVQQFELRMKDIVDEHHELQSELAPVLQRKLTIERVAESSVKARRELESLEKKQKDIEARQHQLKEALTKEQAELREYQEKRKGVIDRKVSKIDGEIAPLKEKIQWAETKKTELRNKITEMEKKLGEHGLDMAQLKSGILSRFKYRKVIKELKAEIKAGKEMINTMWTTENRIHNETKKPRDKMVQWEQQKAAVKNLGQTKRTYSIP
jgi:hypothetical protein